MNDTGRIVYGIVLSLSLGVLAACAGAIIAGRTGSDMGWDALADALGGFFIGGIGGLFAGWILARKLQVAALRSLAWAGAVGVVLVVGYVMLNLS